MATITYAHAPAAVVYLVDEETGVNEATITSVTGLVTEAATTVTYAITMTKTSVAVVNVPEEDLFADVDAALAEYKLRYLTPTP